MKQVFSAIKRDKVYPVLSFGQDSHFDALMHEFHPDGRVSVFNQYGDRLELNFAGMGKTAAVQLFEDGDRISYRLYRDVPGNPPEVWVIFDFAARTDRVKVTVEGKLPSPGNISLALVSTQQLRQTGSRMWAGEMDIAGNELHSVAFDWSDAPDGVFDGAAVSFEAAESFHIDPSTVGTSTSSNATWFSYQRKCFYAAGRHWVFYSDGSNGLYRTSTDGTTWSGAIAFRAGILASYDFSVAFDGTYLHYSYATRTSGGPIYYRRGTPESDGTITWSAVEQTALVGVSDVYPHYAAVAIDSAGYAWIGYLRYTTAATYPYVTRSGNNNGTWGTTPSGFPYQLSATSNTAWFPHPVALTSQRMLVIYALGGTTVKSKRWDGSAWGAEKATSSAIQHGAGSSATADGDNVNMVFLKTSPYDIVHCKFVYASDAWGAETAVRASTTSTSYPVLVRDGSNLYCFWAGAPTAHHIYYKRYDGVNWDVNPTDWIDESTDNLTGNDRLSCFYGSLGSKIGLVYSTRTATPYNIRYAFLVLVVPPTVTTQACTNVEATTATGNGNITDTGGENCTRRGFCYMVGTSGDPTTADSVVYEDGSFGAGPYSLGITGLSPGTNYRVRAYAVNSAGTGYGATVQILTKPAAPTDVAASDGTYPDKVRVTWTKSTGATGYRVYRDGVDVSGLLGDVDVYDDTGADAPTITPGAASASDGTSFDYVALSLSGQSASNGTTYTYKVKAFNATGGSADSSTNTGYRGVGALTYQWQRSAADSDAGYSDIPGATTTSHNDIAAPADGSGRYYRCVLNADGAPQQTSSADRGYRIAQYPDLRIAKGGVAQELCLVAAGSGATGMGGIPKVRKGAATYDIYLVETTDPAASPVRIKTTTGIKAIRKGPSPFQCAIVIWTGTLASIPAGWALCDGNNGTPNLVARFLRGAPAGIDPGTTGGSDSHSHASMTAAGSHTHTAQSQTHAHTVNSAGGHNHVGNQAMNRSGSAQNAMGVGTIGVHQHTTNVDAGHTHTMDTYANHTHPVSSNDGRPPYYEVAFIQAREGVSIVSNLIIIWTGTLASIPAGWSLCDGVGGRPDLRARFVRGVNTGVTNPGTTGGATAHNHTETAAASHSHTMNAGGSHTHTFNAYTWTHMHGIGFDGENPITANCFHQNDSAAGNHTHATSNDPGDHNHNAMGNDGGHSHTVNAASSLPAYYDVAYIINDGGATSIPQNGILIWAGAIADIPAGYNLCDGVGGRPDLRARFVRGSSVGIDPGGTGGVDTHTHTDQNAGGHSSHSMVSAGAHQHAATDSIGAHTHATMARNTTPDYPDINYLWSTQASAGSHSHTYNSGNAHTHTLTSPGNHNHNAWSTDDGRPAYYEVAFIIKA